ncbi:hypothetical protein [Bradyrhizobium sp. SEMIA]|uniref:hypothetical protein n=1 Tax=Bradyrhizobium sp. SEMIA TaxID=2597515 RepID=UPI0018A3957C|nr:hypothetical protein [Bradyrhizobium sp. SEMIA]QOG20457.1 hypothetical protein FOM02_26990 [Bradyrhizobium sp. SEMIA]
MNMLDDVEFQVAKLELGRRDVLVVRTERPLTSVMAAELRAQLERRLDLQARVLIVDPAVELAVVSRSEAKKLSDKREGA